MNTSIYSQLIILNKKHNEHYLKRYVKLVSFFKERNLKKKKFIHHEHHIVPESFGGPDTVDNLVCITPREHFILHWMLYKAFPKSQMTTAFHMMCNFNKINSKVFEKLQIENSKRVSEHNLKRVAEGTNPFSGGKLQRKQLENGTHPWQDKEKARERANKLVAEGRHHFQDKEKASQRTKKLVEERRHNFCGPELQRKRLEDGTHPFSGKNNPVYKQLSDGTHPWQGDGEQQRENNRKMIENGTHPSQIKKLCEHCKQEFDLGNYGKWHGDKCKLNPLYKEKINPKIECPHCKREFDRGNYKQHHGDKCKLNPFYKEEIKEKFECTHCNRFFSKGKFTRYHGNNCKLNPQI